MIHKMIALLLLPLAFGMMVISAEAKSNKAKMTKMTMTGCLQPGTDPNTFVLNHIGNGSIQRNTTGKPPLAEARTEDPLVIPANDKTNLQKYVGQRVKISGFMSGPEETISSTTVTTTPYGTEVTPPATANVSQFNVTRVQKISGTCR